MYVVVLAGGIASGKSTVARELAARGAHLQDLDVLAREVVAPGSPTLAHIARAFGSDVLDAEDTLRRDVLARRAFASEQATRELERITHPAIRERLAHWLAEQGPNALCVVEIPLLDRMEDAAAQANEVICVVCPREVRRERAMRRGMTGEDFDARVRQQPSDAYLAEHATTVFTNDQDEQTLKDRIDTWWRQRAKSFTEFAFAAPQE